MDAFLYCLLLVMLFPGKLYGMESEYPGKLYEWNQNILSYKDHRAHLPAAQRTTQKSNWVTPSVT